jgi:ribokinase
MVPPEGDRTIVVVGEPLHPRRDDSLPWDALALCDAAYFTAQDEAALQAARAARLLVVTARRREALIRSGVRADLVIGSAADPREAHPLEAYPVRPGALVLTEGARGGAVFTEEGSARFAAPAAAPRGSQAAHGAARPGVRPQGGEAQAALPAEGNRQVPSNAAYGAGDSFAAALVYYLAAGLPPLQACARAGPHGAAVLGCLDPWLSQLPLTARNKQS